MSVSPQPNPHPISTADIKTAIELAYALYRRGGDGSDILSMTQVGAIARLSAILELPEPAAAAAIDGLDPLEVTAIARTAVEMCDNCVAGIDDQLLTRLHHAVSDLVEDAHEHEDDGGEDREPREVPPIKGGEARTGVTGSTASASRDGYLAIPSRLLHDIASLVTYNWAAEAKDFAEQPSPAHVFLAMQRLRAWLGHQIAPDGIDARVHDFIAEIAQLTKDGEEVDGEEYILENDDAVDTLLRLITDARDLIVDLPCTDHAPPDQPCDVGGSGSREGFCGRAVQSVTIRSLGRAEEGPSCVARYSTSLGVIGTTVSDAKNVGVSK
jgi:hypothetical protein